MKIKEALNTLTEADVYSFLLFTLFQMSDNPGYGAISELAFLLDKESLLKLCEYYGGLTITIPKIEDLNDMLTALKFYKEVHIDKLVDSAKISNKKIRDIYNTICKTMEGYSFGDREFR